MKSCSSINDLRSKITNYHTQINFEPGQYGTPSKCDNKTIKWSVMRWVNQYKQPFEMETILHRVAKKRGVSVLYLEQEWDWKRYFSSFWGDIAHNELEHLFLYGKFRLIENTEAIKDKIKQFVTQSLTKYDLFFKEEKEKNLLIESVSQHKKYLFNTIPVLANKLLAEYDIIGTEITIVNPQLCGGISGIVDALVQDKQTKEIGILDFKTNKKFSRTTDKYFNKLLPPFQKFPECEHTIYTLQLLAYQSILKESYQIETTFLKNIWLNANVLDQENTDVDLQHPYLIIDAFDDKEFIKIFKSEFFSNFEPENLDNYLDGFGM